MKWVCVLPQIRIGKLEFFWWGGGGVQPLIKKTRKFFLTTIAWMSQEYPSTSKFQIIRDFPNTGVRVNAGLAKPVPGPSRGMLFRTASILVVVVWDAEPKRDRKSSESCMLTSLSYFYDGPRRSLICVRKWKRPSTSERWKIWRKTSQLFPIRGFEQKSVIMCFTIIPFYSKPNSYPKTNLLLIYLLFIYKLPSKSADDL